METISRRVVLLAAVILVGALLAAAEKAKEKVGSCRRRSCNKYLKPGTSAPASGAMTDWRTPDEKAMSCQHATSWSGNNGPLYDSLCSSKIYTNMNSQKQTCETASPLPTLQYCCPKTTAGYYSKTCKAGEECMCGSKLCGFTYKFITTADGPDKARQGPKVSGDPCGYTVYTERVMEARTRQESKWAHCCVASSCAESTHQCYGTNSGKDISPRCVRFKCTVKKWTRCTAKNGERLQWRANNVAASEWLAVLDTVACQSYKECSCSWPTYPPSNRGFSAELQKTCATKDLLTPCSST